MDLRKSFNGKPKATAFWQRSRLRLAVKRNALSSLACDAKGPGYLSPFLGPARAYASPRICLLQNQSDSFKTIAETAPSRNVWFARTLAIDCTYPRAGGKVGQTFFKKFLISKCINSGSLLRIKLIACALSDSCEVNEVSDLMNWRTMKFLSLPDSIRVRVSQCCLLL